MMAARVVVLAALRGATTLRPSIRRAAPTRGSIHRQPTRLCSTAPTDGADDLETRRSAVLQALEKATQKEANKANALRDEKRKAEAAEALSHRANLIFSNLYRIDGTTRTIEVEDWEDDGALVAIDLDPSFRSAKDEADAGFKKARRLRRGSAVVEGLLSESAERAEALLDLAAECAAAADDDALDIVAKRAAKRGAAPAAKPKPKAPPPSQKQKRREWTGRTFSSPAGVPILVGRSRRENDHLSLVIARDGDVWLHARNAPGAHVLLQLSRAPRFYREPDAACLAMAANLAAFYSDLRTEAKADVTYTSPKHISKPPKAPPGAVTLREELGNVVGRPDDVPDECKAKRDESGIASSW